MYEQKKCTQVQPAKWQQHIADMHKFESLKLFDNTVKAQLESGDPLPSHWFIDRLSGLFTAINYSRCSGRINTLQYRY